MELLAPAGGMEQLRAAVAFGADAVYLAAERFGMRARAANFRMDEIPAAVAFAHDHGVKVHVTCNILMHPDDIDGCRRSSVRWTRLAWTPSSSAMWALSPWPGRWRRGWSAM